MKPEEFFAKTHPDYSEYIDVWNGLETSYYGGQKFITKFLWPYEGEETDDLTIRKQQAAYENHFQDINERREALVYSRKINRKIESTGWESIKKNTNGKGLTWEQFVHLCFRLSQIYGFLPVLTDRPSTDDEAITREQESGNDPYAIAIPPQSFKNWSLNRDGMLDWCVIKSTVKTRIPLQETKAVEQYRLISRDLIQVWQVSKDRSGKQKFEIVNEIEHGLNRVPVVILNDLDPKHESLVGRPSLHDAVDLSVLLFNMQSWYTQLLYKTNYSTLAASPWG